MLKIYVLMCRRRIKPLVIAISFNRADPSLINVLRNVLNGTIAALKGEILVVIGSSVHVPIIAVIKAKSISSVQLF